MDNSLLDRCRISSNTETDSFVGVKAVDRDFSIHFPMGYRTESDEAGLRKDVLLLLRVLARNTDRKDSEVSDRSTFESLTMPIQAYLYVISDYYARGYYKERETLYEVAKKGKISWGRTVKSQRAYIQDDEAYYLDFVTKRNRTQENELITLIHEYCVYESFVKMGWLFTSFVPVRPKLKFHKNLFLRTLKAKIEETFNDRNRLLFKNLLAIVQSLGDEGSVTNFKYGTTRFEYVWESMIDKTYGIRNKGDYFPKTKWALSGGKRENAPLEPDTIMITGGKIYVLDAKYYKYGWTGITSHLPGSSSINKQITYGEYIAESKRFKNEKGDGPTVYNAFLMPYDSYGKTFHTEEDLHFVGFATGDWKDSTGEKPYEKVAGILLDTKALMQNSMAKADRISELAELIQQQIDGAE